MISLGTDPELFLRDVRTGAVTPVVGLIGGTKDEPIPMEGMLSGFAMQEDNVMLEFNIPPATSAQRFARRVETGLSFIAQLVRTSLPHHEVDVGACARLFSFEALQTPQAAVFGCSPDFNAHMQGQPWPTVKPVALETDGGAWRFAGGHVHLGYEAGVPDYVAAAFADVFLGLPSVALDEQGERRKLYGQAGRYRPTDWGIEYRTLSNFWIWDTQLSTQVGARAYSLGYLLENGDEAEMQRLYAEIPWSDVQAAINNEDEELAADLIVYCSSDLGMEGL
jgi:hypothetical protein